MEELGGYRLIEELGAGGMGVVHLGIDGGNSPVAVKVLHPHISSDETARRRLAREVRTLRRIKHPRIAEVLDAELESDRPFIITEFVDGTTLSEDVRENGPFQEDELVHFGHALLDALNAVHDAGVIHRDLKPANVMIMDGEPMVIDFGIAQVADEVKVTATGLVMGTPGYLSPEIADGKPSSEKTDWWGWAATMVFAATGRNPFGSGPLEAVLGRVAMGRADLDDVPPRFVPLLRACLEPKPERRPSGAMILQALVDIESGRVPELGGGTSAQIPRADAIGAAGAYPGQPRAHHGPPQTAVGLPAVAQQDAGPPGQYGAGGPQHGAAVGSAGPPMTGPPVGSPPAPPQRGQGYGLQPGERPYGALTLDEAARQRQGQSSPNGYVGAAYAGGPHGPGQPGPHGQMQPYGQGRPVDAQGYSPYSARGRRLPGAAWFMLALNLFAIAFTALGPLLVAIVMLLWQVVARTAGRLHAAQRRRFVEYGPQSASGWSAVARAPGSALASILTSTLSLILPTVAAAAAAVLAWLDVVGIVPEGRNEEWALWTAALVFGVVLWLGPGSQNLRLGSRVLVAPLVRSPRAEGIWAIALVVLAALALTTALGGASAVWWPSPENPFDVLPEPGL
ncbi:Serine/threonine protein kinase [Brevibacterium sp. Mu109]|uniref:serine/threonine-protein kinase n=1 Tax=Brevibacterium sp. Mu109 TaxID=1255669 RepID=UPI000C3D9AE0|nr:serine/threonine-protein kinase [Brevibacterium sp. Mu109]SMX72848.1 Serine/threonine protein kinase [Brevibacterium sp. Mu109]